MQLFNMKKVQLMSKVIMTIKDKHVNKGF